MGDKKKDSGVRVWLRRDVYERFRSLKPEGMGDNQFLTYLLNLYEKTGKEELEKIWTSFFTLHSASNTATSSSPLPKNGEEPAPSPSDLDGWDV